MSQRSRRIFANVIGRISVEKLHLCEPGLSVLVIFLIDKFLVPKNLI